MNISSVLDELRPLADLSHEIVHTQQGAHGWASCALGDLLSSASSFERVSIPSYLYETIDKLIIETNKRLEVIPQITENLKQFIEDHAERKSAPSYPQGLLNITEVNNIFNDCPIPTIRIFYEMSKKATGMYYGTEFRVETSSPIILNSYASASDEWTWEFRSPKRLIFGILFREGISEEAFDKFVGTFPDGGVKDDEPFSSSCTFKSKSAGGAELAIKPKDEIPGQHPVRWAVGLTCDEMEMLTLHPLVKRIGPYRPHIHWEMHGIL